MYRKPTIAQEGGLQTHLENQGVDWSMFLRLHEAGLTDTAIGKVVGKHAKTISRWRQILEQEQHFAKG